VGNLRGVCSRRKEECEKLGIKQFAMYLLSELQFCTFDERLVPRPNGSTLGRHVTNGMSSRRKKSS
jgi:hypothetical protein